MLSDSLIGNIFLNNKGSHSWIEDLLGKSKKANKRVMEVRELHKENK
mgnify:CR=1 FL=1